MAKQDFTVLDLLDLNLDGQNALGLYCLSGRKGLRNLITVPDLNRPGLALSGFYDSFAYQRVQLFGQGEVAYIEKLIKEEQLQTFSELFSYDIPCCIFSRGLTPPPDFTEFADKVHCPILQTKLESTQFSSRLLRVFSNIFAPTEQVYAVMVEVFGLGVIIIGDTGIGKSETALELVERGHCLIADDAVQLRCVNGNTLLGQGVDKKLNHNMEIRGLGIIDVSTLYGISAIRGQKEVQLVIKLENWDPNQNYDRLGTESPKTMEFLGVNIPVLTIPVKPGRNLPIIIEAAAKNQRLRSMGYSSAQTLDEIMRKRMETSSKSIAYYGDEDSY
jgi:HPr kinase/phosphorylase